MVARQDRGPLVRDVVGAFDLGPEGGDKGGEIVATGTPEQVVKEPRSYTGRYLKPLLAAKAERVAAE